MTTVTSPAEMVAKIEQYRKLPERERPSFGKTILDSFQGAEKYWSEVQRVNFWTQHGVLITQLQGKDTGDSKEEPINWRAGVRFPAYFYAQVHPEDDALGMMTRYVEGMQSPIQDPVAFCQSIFVLPAEHAYYKAALGMLEERLAGKKLADFNPNEWEGLLKSINAALGKKGGKMRTETSLVVNTLKFFKELAKKDSFRAIDQYFVAKPDQLRFWKEIRVRVFNFVYKNGSDAFTKEEIEFLENHDLFHPRLCPPPRELPKLMKEFCRDLPETMAKATDVFDLMAYAHQKMVHIHYFTDENGRSARILMALLALQAGIPPVLLEGNRDYLLAVADKNPAKLAELLRKLSGSQRDSLAGAREPMFEMLLQGILGTSQMGQFSMFG